MPYNSLVTLAEAKAALRFDANEHDVRLSLLIEAASLAVLRYIKSDGDEYRDTGGALIPGNVPGDIKLAVIMLAGISERNWDDNEDKIFASDYLPAPVEAILHSRRDPTLA